MITRRAVPFFPLGDNTAEFARAHRVGLEVPGGQGEVRAGRRGRAGDSANKFAQQGIKRAAIFKPEAKRLGVKIKKIYWTLGDHDGLLILAVPYEYTASTASLHLGAMGNVHTPTCRAFTADEMDKIVSKAHPA